jgi:hypothetical protein
MHALVTSPDGLEHLALSMGRLDNPEPMLTRVRSECLSGDTLFSLRCDCGPQLQAALRAIASAGRGVLLVVNLLNHHAQYDVFVNRLRQSFADQVLVVEGADVTNSIVFAFKEPRWNASRSSPLRPPKQLDAHAARQLAAGFALILTALKDQRT